MPMTSQMVYVVFNKASPFHQMVGTYGGGGSLREQFHLDRQESAIALTGLYGNNPATDLRNKFNAFGEMYSSQLIGVNYANGSF